MWSRIAWHVQCITHKHEPPSKVRNRYQVRHPMIIQFASILTAPPSAYSQYKRVTSDRKVIVIRSLTQGKVSR